MLIFINLSCDNPITMQVYACILMHKLWEWYEIQISNTSVQIYWESIRRESKVIKTTFKKIVHILVITENRWISKINIVCLAI